MIEYKVIVDDDGYIKWFNVDGSLYMEDVPALDGSRIKRWYKNEKRHRENGPAIVDDNHVEFWLDGNWQFSLRTNEYNNFIQYFIKANNFELSGKKYKLVEDKQ